MLASAIELVRLLPEPAYLLEETGEIRMANQAAAGLSGLLPSQLPGRHLGSLVVDEEKLRHYLRMCRRSKQLVPGAAQWLRPDDRPLDMRCDGAALVGGDPRDALVFLRCRPRVEATDHFRLLNEKIADLSREILQRRKAERRRDELLVSERAARVQAETDSRLKDEFLATLSHELRTPLNSILGWAHILRQRPLSGDTAEGLSIIERNARAQARLVEDLLDMSRVVAGTVRLQVQPVNLVTVLESALDAVRPAVDAKQLRVQVALDTSAGVVRGDPNRLVQIFWNLLTNAVKFSSKSGRIQISLERIDSRLEVTISDEGEGIASEFLPHVFERFRQADSSTTRQHGGLGLGLAIVRHLTELHGGYVRASSQGAGKGATFVVTLPVAAIHSQQEQPGALLTATVAPPPVQSMQVDLAGLRVLVVDDDHDSREIVARLLEVHGAYVRSASSAAEAMAALSLELPDVLVSDLGMPGEDGFQLVRRIRQLPVGEGGVIPAIALSAFAGAADRTRAKLAGFQVHLAKPVEPEELTASVASLALRR